MGLRLSSDLLRTASRIAIAAGAAALLTGCSNAAFFGSSEQPAAAAMIATFEKGDPENQDYAAAAAYWGAKYEANRGDIRAATNFARNLRLMGGARQAVAVLKEIVMKAPDDANVSSEYGKALTGVGRSQDAIPFLARATQMDGTDWTTFSAYGVALDQNGNHEIARKNYEIALKLSPANASVESNLAMSYILTGRIDQAETILRRLVSGPEATPQMRQNLAMIATLKGNSTEAEQLAREDLPAEQAANNLTVLRQLDADNMKAPMAVAPEAVIVPEAAPTPVAEAPAPIEEETKQEVGETAIIETTPVAIAEPAPAPAPAAAIYQMAPIADDAETPTPITPKTIPTARKTEAKPAAISSQSSLLRKSQEPVSIANVGN